MTDLLAHIKATPWLAELLENQFDFDISRTDPVEPVHLASGETLTPIAGDGSGGTYLLTPSGAVVYAGSEGEGGLVAHNLRDALTLIVGLPSLFEGLYTTPGDELNAWLDDADEAIREDDAYRASSWLPLDDARATVRRELQLPPANGLLEALHAAAADEAFRPVSDHGPYRSML